MNDTLFVISLFILLLVELVPVILIIPGDTLVEKTKNYRALLSAKPVKSKSPL